MRKVIAGVMMSLDGVMQAPGGPEDDPTGGFKFGGWTFPYLDEVLGQAMDKSFGAPFDLLLGRKTYEIFAAYWPHVGAKDAIGQRFNKVTKYVATTVKTPLTWQKSVALAGGCRVATAPGYCRKSRICNSTPSGTEGRGGLRRIFCAKRLERVGGNVVARFHIFKTSAAHSPLKA